MKKIAIYTTPRSSFLGLPIKEKLLKELEESYGSLYDLQEITGMGIELTEHEFLISDEGFDILANEWEARFNDSEIHEMGWVYMFPSELLKDALEKLKEVKELFTIRVVTFLLCLPEETSVLIEAQPVEEDE